MDVKQHGVILLERPRRKQRDCGRSWGCAKTAPARIVVVAVRWKLWYIVMRKDLRCVDILALNAQNKTVATSPFEEEK
jgi:hypothetical protein